MRAVVALALIAATATPAASSPASSTPPASPASTVRIHRGARPATSEGEVELSVDADVAYAALADLARWPAIFPRFRAASAHPRADGVLVVELISHKGKRHTLLFRNDAATRTIRFSERGRADVDAELALLAGDRPGRARVRARLHASVTGFAGLFVSDATIRRKRDDKLASYLGDVERYFAR